MIHAILGGQPAVTDSDSVRLESIGRDGRGLRVVFNWHRDRYAHRLQFLRGRSTTLLLSTVEGNADQRWPPSPPFQQLSVEDRSDGSQVALLVGMAGRSHWSASVQTATDRPRIEFDVACLAHELPSRLGSAYRLARAPIRADATSLMLGVLPDVAAEKVAHSNCQEVPGCSLQVAAVAEHLLDEPSGHLLVDGTLLSVTCSFLAESVPATMRWKYDVELAPNGIGGSARSL